MADSISPWLDWAALRWDSSYGSMVPENSHESYEAGSHAQILAVSHRPWALRAAHLTSPPCAVHERPLCPARSLDRAQ